jgi:signal transduction histidine kinase
MEKLGGRIEVKSEEGKGATFTLYLPKKTPKESEE